MYYLSLYKKLSAARYLKLSAGYEQKQQRLAIFTETLEQELENNSAQTVDLDKFIVPAEKYVNVTTLTSTWVNELIAKVVVYSP